MLNNCLAKFIVFHISCFVLFYCAIHIILQFLCYMFNIYLLIIDIQMVILEKMM